MSKRRVATDFLRSRRTSSTATEVLPLPDPPTMPTSIGLSAMAPPFLSILGAVLPSLPWVGTSCFHPTARFKPGPGSANVRAMPRSRFLPALVLLLALAGCSSEDPRLPAHPHHAGPE